MKIGILQTGMVPEQLSQKHGEYPAMFERFLSNYGFEFEAYAVVSGDFPASIKACDGWLITGSRHGAYENHPWIPKLEALIREIHAAELPLVGVCFGHQIIAQALGGKVEKFGGLWGVGHNEYHHPDGTSSRLLAMHQDQVVELPPGATVTATSDFCKYAGLSYKGKTISIQPHPEFTPEFMTDLIDQRKGTVIPMDAAEKALETLDQDNDSHRFAVMIADFFLKAQKEQAA